MTDTPVFSLALQILAGLSLAACCGLRAFLPPFIAGLLARLGQEGLLPINVLPLADGLQWLSGTPALIVFGTATLLELAADKIPAIDHLLDMVQTVIRPLAGALVFAASLSSAEPLHAAIAGLIGGGSIAGGVHLLKAKIRLISTLGTAGIASPVLSIIEDMLALAGSVLAMVAAIIAVILISSGVLLTWVLVRKFMRRVGRLGDDSASPLRRDSSGSPI
jgi:hypothetical protein